MGVYSSLADGLSQGPLGVPGTTGHSCQSLPSPLPSFLGAHVHTAAEYYSQEDQPQAGASLGGV